MAITDDPLQLVLLVVLAVALVASGMFTGYKVGAFAGINPVIGSYVGLAVAVTAGIFWINL